LKIIGLCGGSGSGKGTVAELFSEFGFKSVDTDNVYHTLTSQKSQCLDALVDEFGESILNNDGSLNRKKLAEIVFHGEGSKVKLDRLNKISHYYILMRTRELLSDYERDGVPAALVDAPLLFESGFNKECDIIIAVVADTNIRIARIAERDGISVDAAIARIKSQLSDDYLIENSDFVIDNSGKIEDTKRLCKEIAELILNSKEN